MKNKKSKFKAGMYLLETLTAGMYNEPLSIYREYIQNSIDSFDLVKQAGRRGPQLVKIDIDPSQKYISVYDNGAGIPNRVSEKTLSSIGSSDKRLTESRGFRGIGRLGGIAFCDKAVFKTKAMGERVESVQIWDCQKLKLLLADSSQFNMSLKELFSETTSFHTNNGLDDAGSYFKVELYNVSSFRNHILDIQKIEKYLQTVAPVAFNPDEFEYSQEIQAYLRRNVPNYGELSIKLNGRKIYKPYKSSIKTTSKKSDSIKNIDFIEIEAEDKVVAYGWMAKRSDLIGAIAASEAFSGIRVKDGNITIGDNRILEKCFRETRFNSYTIGELHIVSPNLIPNSRRDDFVDNKTKALFYDDVERKLGLPMSKAIRQKSRLKAIESQTAEDAKAETGASAHVAQKETKERKSREIKFDFITAQKMLNEILNQCGHCEVIKGITKKYGLKY